MAGGLWARRPPSARPRGTPGWGAEGRERPPGRASWDLELEKPHQEPSLRVFPEQTVPRTGRVFRLSTHSEPAVSVCSVDPRFPARGVRMFPTPTPDGRVRALTAPCRLSDRNTTTTNSNGRPCERSEVTYLFVIGKHCTFGVREVQ